MSAGTMIDHAARVARAMRLEEMLINASAVPIPIDLMPSAIQGAIADIVAGSETAPPADGDVRTIDHEVQTQDALHADDAAAGEMPRDAILHGLQAAADAIHERLRQDASLPARDSTPATGAEATGSVINSAGAISSIGLDALPMHGAADLLDTPHLDMTHVSENASPVAPHAIAAGNGAPLDIVAQVAQGLTDQSPLAEQSPAPLNGIDVPSVASTALAGTEMALKPMLDTVTNSVSSLLAPDANSQHTDALTSSAFVTHVAETVADVAQTVGEAAAGDVPGSVAAANTTVAQVVETAGSLADTVTDATATGIDLVHNLAQDVGQDIAHDLVAQDPVTAMSTTVASTVDNLSSTLIDAVSSSAQPLAPAVTESVTVASLGGAGTDALAGLLQPGAGAMQATHLAADAGHASMQDIASFTPIGIEHVADIDAGATHAVHSTLHLVGSGLI